eukprot:1157016-Pelagomonas_calceolata.AAC.10
MMHVSKRDYDDSHDHLNNSDTKGVRLSGFGVVTGYLANDCNALQDLLKKHRNKRSKASGLGLRVGCKSGRASAVLLQMIASGRVSFGTTTEALLS